MAPTQRRVSSSADLSAVVGPSCSSNSARSRAEGVVPALRARSRRRFRSDAGSRVVKISFIMSYVYDKTTVHATAALRMAQHECEVIASVATTRGRRSTWYAAREMPRMSPSRAHDRAYSSN